jgi:hypothetical protein
MCYIETLVEICGLLEETDEQPEATSGNERFGNDFYAT